MGGREIHYIQTNPFNMEEDSQNKLLQAAKVLCDK